MWSLLFLIFLAECDVRFPVCQFDPKVEVFGMLYSQYCPGDKTPDQIPYPIEFCSDQYVLFPPTGGNESLLEFYNLNPQAKDIPECVTCTAQRTCKDNGNPEWHVLSSDIVCSVVSNTYMNSEGKTVRDITYTNTCVVLVELKEGEKPAIDTIPYHPFAEEHPLSEDDTSFIYFWGWVFGSLLVVVVGALIAWKCGWWFSKQWEYIKYRAIDIITSRPNN